MSPRRIVFAALALALFGCEQPASMGVDVEPALARNPTGTVAFELAGVVEQSEPQLWAEGTPWAITVSFEPVLINEDQYALIEFTFEIDGETISAVDAALSVEAILCSECDPPLADTYSFVDSQNGWNGTLKGSAVDQLGLTFQDFDGDLLGPQFDVTQPLDLDEWEVHNGGFTLANFPGMQNLEIQCFRTQRGPAQRRAGRPDEPGRPPHAGRPCGLG